MSFKFLRAADPFLFLAMLLLLVFGLMVILSLNREVFERQVIFALSGLTLYFLTSLFDYRFLRKVSIGIYAAITSLLALVLITGVVTRGAVRWLEFAGSQFQPSEFSKIALILLLAFLLSSRSGYWPSVKTFLLTFLLAAGPALLVFWQPDLGTTIILLCIWLGMVVAAGLRLSHLVLLFGGGFLLLIPFWSLLRDYQRQRIVHFLNPASDPLGGGYNVLQSMIAVGSGQIWGRGFGRGTQSHLQFLPEYYTDFVFASLAEEWGFIGSLLVLALFGVLLVRILLVARNAADDFGSLLCVGVFVFLASQFFINVGMNMGLMPVTGVPLPLISYGGSSLWVTMIALGLVQSVAIRRER